MIERGGSNFITASCTTLHNHPYISSCSRYLASQACSCLCRDGYVQCRMGDRAKPAWTLDWTGKWSEMDWMMDSIEIGFTLLWVAVLAAELSRKASPQCTCSTYHTASKLDLLPFSCFFTTQQWPFLLSSLVHSICWESEHQHTWFEWAVTRPWLQCWEMKATEDQEWCSTPRQLQHLASTNSNTILWWCVHNTVNLAQVSCR